MSDMQIKVSRKREDVRNAKDYRLLFSSGWPVLEPLAHGLIPVGTTAGSTILHHGLGFRPMFLIWNKNSNRLSTIRNYLSGYFSSPTNDGFLPVTVDEERMYIEAGAGTTTYDYYYTIFNVDLDAPFESEGYNPGATTEATNGGDDFVVRVTRNKSVKPNTSRDDPRDFAINTDYQPIPVHQVTQRAKAVNSLESIRILHQLGYPPNFFIYGHIHGSTAGYKYMEIAPESSNGIVAAVDNDYLNLSIMAPFDLSIVILKDPII